MPPGFNLQYPQLFAQGPVQRYACKGCRVPGCGWVVEPCLACARPQVGSPVQVGQPGRGREGKPRLAQVSSPAWRELEGLEGTDPLHTEFSVCHWKGWDQLAQPLGVGVVLRSSGRGARFGGPGSVRLEHLLSRCWARPAPGQEVAWEGLAPERLQGVVPARRRGLPFAAVFPEAGTWCLVNPPVH